MSEERQLAVLRAIVEDYVETREPVGSRAIVDRHHLGVSSATVRNDMAALEDAGLITAPHTSAGRIPTDKGYRYFVDRLQQIRPLSRAERQAIRTLLDGVDDLEEVMMRSVRLLSNLTQQVALIRYPVISRADVASLELVALHENTVLLVLITSHGDVVQRHIHAASFAENEVEDAKKILRELVIRVSLKEAARRSRDLAENTSQEDRVPYKRAWFLEMASALAELCASFDSSKILMSGTAHLARSNSDFASTISPVLEALEEQVVLLKLLSEIAWEQNPLEVRIGEENDGVLKETALVVAQYGSQNVRDGALGVLGPTRMDYASSMSSVRAVARYITRILTAENS